MKNTTIQSRLRVYSSMALSSTALLATHADAATVVDVNSATFDTGLSDIGTVSAVAGSYTTPGYQMPGMWMPSPGYYPGMPGKGYPGGGYYMPGPYVPPATHTTTDIVFSGLVAGINGNSFLRSADENPVTRSGSTQSFRFSDEVNGSLSGTRGARLGSDDNWLHAVSASDPTQSVWLQFQFGDDPSVDFSIVKAVIETTPGELTSAFAASSFAAVPEPSALALLTLGAGGMFIRRRKQAA